MPIKCRRNWPILFLGMVLAGGLSANAESFCVTHSGELAIGTVERNQFTADIWVTDWQVSPEGKKIQVGALVVFHVARDGRGRVTIKGPLIYTDRKNPEKLGEPTSWPMIICDPIADTTAWFQQFQRSVNQPAKKQAQVTTVTLIPGLNRHHYLDRNRLGQHTKWMDLGNEQLQGFTAQGYRWWEKDSNGAVVEGDFTEQWISQDLDTELAVVRMNQTDNHEQRTELIHIKRVESDPSLFQIPPDYEVTPMELKPPAAH